MSEHGLPDQVWTSALHSLFPDVGSSSGSPGVEKDESSYCATVPSPMSQHGVGRPFENRAEARFFMHYVHDLASWVDICDRRHHFGTEVPKRACQSPLLAYSIIAFSSRHLCLTRGTEAANPATYYSRALQILIPILGGPIEALNEDILVAIVLLRLYEEMSDADCGTHLFGSSRLLNSISSFATKGGLGEAASWIVLRQDMYFSLTKSLPLCIYLESYKNSTSFVGIDAESRANRAVFLSAQVLAYAFRPDMDTAVDVDTWKRLDEDVGQWLESSPWHAAPLWVETPGEGNDSASAFPTVWMTRPAHVAGYQHYCLARMLLNIFNPHLSKPGFQAFKRRREADEAVVSNLRLLIGLAISNPSVVNASFTASHALQSCGMYLTDPREQKEALEFLDRMEKRTGWRTRHVAHHLISQWSQGPATGAFGFLLNR